MGQYISNTVDAEPLNQTEAPLPAFVVPAHLPFTPGQLSELVNAGQQPGVPFQIGESNAQRAVGERKNASVVELAANIRKGSVYLRRTTRDGSKLSVGFKYDSKVPLQLNIYITAKDRTDSQKLKISDSRAVVGPYTIGPGEGMEWSSQREDAYIDLLALNEKPRKENSVQYDVIIVTRQLFPKGSSRPEKAMIFLASMCRLSSPGAVFDTDSATAEGVNKEKGYKSFPLTCVVQKVQSKTGVFTIEEVYGLETVTQRKANRESGAGNNAENRSHNHSKEEESSEHGSTSGDCVICLSDPSSVALYPCRHWCVCMACAEALPSQQNTCPVCRQPFYLLIDFKRAETGERANAVV